MGDKVKEWFQTSYLEQHFRNDILKMVPHIHFSSKPHTTGNFFMQKGNVLVAITFGNQGTVKPVYNDRLMGYFSAFWG